MDTFAKHAPERKIPLRRKPSPWTTPEIHQLKQERDKVYKLFRRTGPGVDFSNCKTLRIELNFSIVMLSCDTILYSHPPLFSSDLSPSTLWSNAHRLGIVPCVCSRVPEGLSIHELNRFFASTIFSA